MRNVDGSVISVVSVSCFPVAILAGIAAAYVKSLTTRNGNEIAAVGWVSFLIVVSLGTVLGCVALWATRGIPRSWRRPATIFGALQLPIVLGILTLFGMLWWMS